MAFSSISVTIKLRVTVVTGVLLLLPLMISKPFERVRYRTVSGPSVTNTQVKRDIYALFKDKKIKGFHLLSHSGKRTAAW